MSNEEFTPDGADNIFERAKKEARDKYEAKSLKELVIAMKDRAIEKEQAENRLKIINAHYDVLRFEKIPERMDSDGVEKITLEGIGRVSLTADLQLSVKGGAKDELFGWLRKRKLGSLIQEGVNASTLKAFVKGRIKEGKDYPSELLNVTPITRASITKA